MRSPLATAAVCALSLVFIAPAHAASQPFAQWLEGLKKEARKKGLGDKALSALDGLEPIPRVIELDRKQPEGTMTFEQYLEKVVRPDRIAEGRLLRSEHKDLLEAVASQHGVDPEFMVALWGVETSFGRITGNYSVVAALATLAHDGRRSAMFRAQLFDALKIIDQGHITPDAMKGSWAGAMGQCQFMPGTFIAYAFDQDGDGRKDIWSTLPDVFGSTSNYLRRIGWKRGAGWGQEVVLPEGFDTALLGQNVRKSAAEWAELGVKAKDGGKLTAPAPASVLRPAKNSQKVYLVHGNYRALLKWNRSEYFATAVSLLADAIAAPEPPPVPAAAAE
jgi:membrane-bound lytic murein transglycosylase B